MTIDSKAIPSEGIGPIFKGLCETIAALRHPVTGCPWDLEQTHATLRKYMIEEAYEAAEVMDPPQPLKLVDELGDVLLQVVLNAQLGSDQGDFSIIDVVQGLDAKMRRRHPHVFGSDDERLQRGRESIRTKWEDVKKAEKQGENARKTLGLFSSLKPGTVTPALQMSVAIGKIAKKIHFDWPNVDGVLDQFKSEVQELEAEITSGDDKNKIYEELGDVFFSLGQLCRHLEIDPEICAMDGNRKFLNRFNALEEIAKSEGIDAGQSNVETLERLWEVAKSQEKENAKKS